MGATQPASQGGMSLLSDPNAPDVTMSGDIGAELAALCVRSGESQQSQARAARDALEEGEEQAANDQVKDMRDKADAILDQSIAQGIGSIVAGLGTIGEGTAATNTPSVAPGQKQVPGEFWGMDDAQWKGASTLASAGGQLAEGCFQARGADDDANAAADQARAQRLSTAAQDQHDAMGQADSFVQSALEFYREYSQTQAQTRSAAIHAA